MEIMTGNKVEEELSSLDAKLSAAINNKFRYLDNQSYWGTAAGVSRPYLYIVTNTQGGNIGYYRNFSYLCINQGGSVAFIVTISRGDSGLYVNSVRIGGSYDLHSAIELATVDGNIAVRLTKSNASPSAIGVYALRDNTIKDVYASAT